MYTRYLREQPRVANQGDADAGLQSAPENWLQSIFAKS